MFDDSPPPTPLLRAPERKVTFSSIGAYLSLAGVTYAAELIAADPILVTPLPDWLEPLVVGAVPAVVALLAGYKARHTPRPDLLPQLRYPPER